MFLLVLCVIVSPFLVYDRIVVNMSVFHKREMQFYAKNMNIASITRYIIPLAVAMVTTKLLTYFSYGYIPASLTHTVKALQPFFNVLIVFLWTGEGVDRRTILSLFPIVFGVVYASVNELECAFLVVVMLRFNTVGFVCALISTIVGVWQSVYLKMLMRMGMEKNFVGSLVRFNVAPLVQRDGQLGLVTADRLLLRVQHGNLSAHQRSQPGHQCCRPVHVFHRFVLCRASFGLSCRPCRLSRPCPTPSAARLSGSPSFWLLLRTLEKRLLCQICWALLLPL